MPALPAFDADNPSTDNSEDQPTIQASNILENRQSRQGIASMEKILIASPSYDGNVRKEYMKSLMLATESLRERGIKWEILIETATLLHTMRSVMASHALHDPDCTHILFIDTDLSFTPSSINRMLNANAEIIGCVYPYRTIPLHLPTPQTQQTLRKTISSMTPYAIQFPEGTREVSVSNGICEASGLGTGLMLIKKEALAKLASSGATKKHKAGFPYTQWYKEETYFGFFSHLEVDGVELGEDYSFCRRWTQECEGKIHALVDEEISHIGHLPVLGRYTDRLRAGHF